MHWGKSVKIKKMDYNPNPLLGDLRLSLVAAKGSSFHVLNSPLRLLSNNNPAAESTCRRTQAYSNIGSLKICGLYNPDMMSN